MRLCYLSVSRAGVALQVTEVAGGVFQAETGLVPLGHFAAGPDLQQIIVAELVHAVVVPVRRAHAAVELQTNGRLTA